MARRKPVTANPLYESGALSWFRANSGSVGVAVLMVVVLSVVTAVFMTRMDGIRDDIQSVEAKVDRIELEEGSIAALQTEVDALLTEVRELRTELRDHIAKMETKVRDDFAKLETKVGSDITDLRMEIRALRSDTKVEIASVRSAIDSLRTDTLDHVVALRQDLRPTVRAEMVDVLVRAEIVPASHRWLLQEAEMPPDTVTVPDPPP